MSKNTFIAVRGHEREPEYSAQPANWFARNAIAAATTAPAAICRRLPPSAAICRHCRHLPPLPSPLFFENRGPRWCEEKKDAPFIC